MTNDMKPLPLEGLTFRGDSLCEIFSVQAEARNEDIALIDRGRRISYRTLDAVSNAWANELRTRGVTAGDIIPVIMARSAELVAGILAVLKAGAAYSLIAPEWPRARQEQLVERLRAPLVLSTESVDFPIPAFVPPTLEHADRLDTFAGTAAVSGDSPAVVFFTSGSTGIPKAVVSPHRATISLFEDPVFGDFAPGSVMPQGAALPWDAFSLELWGMLLCGGTSVLADGAYLLPTSLRAMVADHGVNILWLTASLFNMFVEEDPGCFDGIERLFIGGERLSPGHVRTFLEAHPGITLVNGYGPVETTVFAAVHEITLADCSRESGIPIGRAVAGRELHVLHDGQPCAPGQPGELFVAGESLALSYLGQPKLTDEKFVQVDVSGRARRMYATGDLVSEDVDGTFSFHGRIGRQVKLRGHRIELAEIETLARRVPGVTDCVAVPRTDANGTCQAIALFYTADPTTGPGPDELRHGIAAHAPGYVVPDHFERFKKFPLSGNGKIDHQRLAALIPGVSSAPQARSGQATDPLEAVVASAFTQVLRRDGVLPHDSFFALGGTSLDAGRLCTKLGLLLETPVPISLLMANPTLGGFLHALRDAQAMAKPPVKPAAHQAGPSASSVELVGMQAGFVMAHEFHPDDLAPLCPSLWKIEGPVDLDALARAVHDVGQRHQALTATYEAIPRPRALVHPDALPQSLRILPPAESEADATRLMREHLIAPQQIEKGEVWKCAAIPFDSAWLFGYCVHHVAFDAWSEKIILGELSQAYAAHRQGAQPEFGEAPATLQQTSAERAQQLTPSQLTRQLDFWRATLADLPPLDFGPAPSPNGTRGRIDNSFTLAASDVAELEKTVADAGTTIFTLLLAHYATALHQVLGQDEFGVGVPVAKRDFPSAEGAVGCMINTLCIPFRGIGPTSSSVLDDTHDLVMKAFAAQDVPFPEVVGAIRSPRSDRNPLFQTMFAFQNVDQQKLDLVDCDVTTLDVEHPRPMHELVVEAWPQPDGGIRFTFDSRPERISADTVQAVQSAYEKLLTNGAAASEATAQRRTTQ
ncbi:MULTISPECIES: amino acid adenylation domain-containing protein [unclassified Streptomyces]|uniref:amino acid adenylation domain-containing protein n=2 Tax=Streptomyces TaxID=1883 RepID=UPI002E25C7B1|nr:MULTISPECIES: amino acid adenylation domain-containing protein [unclassified Streptomyces]